MSYTIIIPGQPVPKQSVKFTKTGHRFKPKKAQEYESRVLPMVRSQWEEVSGKTLNVPIAIAYTFEFQIPKSAIRKTMEDKIKEKDPCPINRDFDNLCKNINDIMEKAGVFTNDSLIVRGGFQKIYSMNPKTVIVVKTLDECG